MISRKMKCVILILLVGFSGSPAMPAEAPKLEKIVVLTLLGPPLPVLVGQMRGTFSKYGIEVTTKNFPNSGLMRKAFGTGIGDLAYAAVDNAVAMVELAGADVQIVSGGEGSQNELIAQPNIKSIEDLRGKTILVDAVNTAYALQLKAILLLHGMQAGRDYELRAYGATPIRLTALLQHKELAGSMLPPPFSIEATQEGMVSLASVPVILGAYQAGGHFAERAWAQQHRETVAKYLAAYIESQRWLMAPENKQQVIELMRSEDHLQLDVAAETYVSKVTGPGGFEKDARLDSEGFKNVLKLRADVEGQWDGKPPSPGKYYDGSYYDAALALIK